MTARDIQTSLMIDLKRRSKVMPNYTPNGWFECDLFEVTESGFFREYEIKVSRSDFKADAFKGAYSAARNLWGLNGERPKSKHMRLASGDERGPNKFSFVVPDGLIEISECPEWAGLMFASRSGWRNQINITCAKPPPKLHGVKFPEEYLSKVFQTTYWRYHDTLTNLRSRFQEITVEHGEGI